MSQQKLIGRILDASKSIAENSRLPVGYIEWSASAGSWVGVEAPRERIMKVKEWREKKNKIIFKSPGVYTRETDFTIYGIDVEQKLTKILSDAINEEILKEALNTRKNG